jgi:hypothetical protein
MAAVTADVSLRILGPEFTRRFVMDSSIAQTWYRGEPIIIDQTADGTNVTPVHDVSNPALTASDVFMGIAAHGGVNVISVAEDLAHGVTAYISPTIVGFKSTVYTTNANAGATLYWESGALSMEGTDTPPLGKMMFVEDGYIYVKLSTAVSTAADA